MDHERPPVMEFMDFPPRKGRRTILPHVMIWAVAALTLVGFGLARDEITGKAEMSDACGFTLVFLLAGYFLGWLPEIWEATKRTVWESFVMPGFVALILAYLYLGFRSYFIQPGAAGLAIFAQVFVMICLSCRFG